MKKIFTTTLTIFFVFCGVQQSKANPPVPTITPYKTQTTSPIQNKQTSTQKNQLQQTNIKTNDTPLITYPKISVPIREDLVINKPTIEPKSTNTINQSNPKQLYTAKDIFVINSQEDDEINFSENKIKTNTTKATSIEKQIQNTDKNTTSVSKNNKEKQIIETNTKENPIKLSDDKTKIEEQKTSIEVKTQPEKITPDKADYYAQLRDNARVLYNSGNSQEAKLEFSKIPDEEKLSDDWLFLGNIAIDENKLVDAVFYYKKSIQSDENNFKAHFNLGNLYLSDNKINMALNEYKQVLKINKNYAYAHYNKGCCYLKNNSLINARYEFGLAIRSNPHEPAFYYNLAYTNKLMGKEKKAQEALEMYNQLMSQ